MKSKSLNSTQIQDWDHIMVFEMVFVLVQQVFEKQIIPAWTPNIFFDQQEALAGHPGGTSGLTLFDKNQLLGRTEIRFKRWGGFNIWPERTRTGFNQELFQHQYISRGFGASGGGGGRL